MEDLVMLGPRQQGAPMDDPAQRVADVLDALYRLETQEKSRELQLAITRIEEGLHWLWQRTAIRMRDQR
jgi:hypothetical protein